MVAEYTKRSIKQECPKHVGTIQDKNGRTE